MKRRTRLWRRKRRGGILFINTTIKATHSITKTMRGKTMFKEYKAARRKPAKLISKKTNRKRKTLRCRRK